MKKGDRVRFSQLATDKNIDPRSRDRKQLGTIIGASRDGKNFRVLWDGLTYGLFYHVSFLEVI